MVSGLISSEVAASRETRHNACGWLPQGRKKEDES
jgi:hypothetical protein